MGACLKRPHKKKTENVLKTDYRLMQVKRIAECTNAAILSTLIKLPFVIKTFVLSIFEWPFKTVLKMHMHFTLGAYLKLHLKKFYHGIILYVP